MSTTQYTVSDTNPISIYPAGLQETITVFNTGANDAFVSDTNSTVGQIPVKAGNSIQWNANTPLYAYIIDGTKPTTIVVVNTAIASPPANVAINGPVGISAIAAPVLIQGGGETLYANSVTVPASGTVPLTINTPVDGLSYEGLSVRLTLTSGAPSTLKYTVSVDADSSHLLTGYITVQPSVANDLGGGVAQFTIPVRKAYPYTLTLYNLLTGAATVTVTIVGVSSVDSVPVSDLSAAMTHDPVYLSASPLDTIFPGSFTPYWIVITTTNGGTASQILISQAAGTGAAYIENIAFTAGDATVLTDKIYAFQVPGNGIPVSLTAYGVSGFIRAYPSGAPPFVRRPVPATISALEWNAPSYSAVTQEKVIVGNLLLTTDASGNATLPSLAGAGITSVILYVSITAVALAAPIVCSLVNGSLTTPQIAVYNGNVAYASQTFNARVILIGR